MNKLTYCWSTDEEEFHGCLATREDALAEAETDGLDDREPGETATVWTAEHRPAIHFLRGREYRIGEYVAEMLDEWLIDDISSDDAIIDLPGDKQAELGKLILDFLEEHASFNRYGVGNTQEHKVVVPPEEAA